MSIVRIAWLVVIVFTVHGLQARKHDATLVSHFVGSSADFAGTSKTFVNHTKHDLAVRWSLKNLQTGQFYTQEPILRRGDKLTIDYDPAVNYHTGAQQLDHSIELLRVIKHPKGADQPLKTKPLKDGDMALALHKNKFLKNDIFELRRNNNGLLVLKASKK